METIFSRIRLPLMALRCFSPLGAKLDWLLCCVLCYIVYLSFNQPCRVGTFLGNRVVSIGVNTWWHQHNMLDITAIPSKCGALAQCRSDWTVIGSICRICWQIHLVCMSSLSVLFIYVENMKPMMHGMSVMMTLQTILINVLNGMYCTKADLHLVCCLFDNG